MIATLLWKEYREQRALWLAIALLAVILTVVLAATLGPPDLLAAFQDEKVRSAILWVVVCLLLTYGVVCGALLLAGDKESHTLDFLDAQIGVRAPLWDAKLKAGVLLVGSQALFLAVLRLCLGQGSWLQLPAWLIMGIDALAWGLLGGALVKSVFPAVLVGVGFLSLSWTVGFMMWDLGQPVVLILKLAGALIGLRYSWAHFCAPDLARRQAAQPEVRRRVRLLPGSWLVFLWLCARQGRLQLGLMLVASVVLGLLLPQAPLYIWPCATLLLGLACGLAVFGYEQSGGQEPFLAAQRLPAGTFWTIKTFYWLLVAIVLTSLIWVVAGIREVMALAYHPPTMSGNREWWYIWFGQGWVIRKDNLPLYLGFWVVHGFIFGLICSLLTRKLVVSAVLSLGVSVLVVGLWLPSLICGGLELWQVSLMPLAFVGMSRLLLWSWLSGRLLTRRPLALLAGGALASICWLGGNLGYRAVEVPAMGEPFDVRAYYAELDQLEKNQAGLLIRQALLEMVDDENQLNKKMGRPTKLIFAQDKEFWNFWKFHKHYTEELDYNDFVNVIILKGWPKEDEEIGRWLDRLFAGPWAQNLEKAVQLPLGLFEDPRLGAPDNRQSTAHLGPYAARYFACRALQLQNQGQEEKTLDHFRIVLALSRQLANQAHNELLGYAGQVQGIGLEGLNHWLHKVGPHSARLRAALVMLQEQEKHWPPLVHCLKAQYVIEMKRDLLPDRKGGPNKQVFFTALQVPWEKERHERIIKALNYNYFQAGERAPSSQAFRGGEKKYNYPLGSHEWSAIQYGILPDSNLTADLSLRRWGKILGTSISGITARHLSGFMVEEYLLNLRHLRAAQLQIALALYQVEQGQPAAKLEDLVPQYLPEVPLDPVSGQPFNYRVSKGEEIDASSGEPLRLQANQGLIWSSATVYYSNYSHFFPVPVWPKK